MDLDRIQKHILATYTTMRIGMGIIAFLFPLSLWLIGSALGVPSMLGSMSAYYHSVMRNLFVGVLFAIGSFLFLYRGYSIAENWALNFAGLFALGVAFFPASPPPGVTAFSLPLLHGISAISFFLSIAFVCVFKSKSSLKLIEDQAKFKRFKTIYLWLGVFMIVLPISTAIIIKLSGGSTAVFWLECLAVWVFSFFWIVKSIEITSTHLERSGKDFSEQTSRLV